jgi:hypothetical protein
MRPKFSDELLTSGGYVMAWKKLQSFLEDHVNFFTWHRSACPGCLSTAIYSLEHLSNSVRLVGYGQLSGTGQAKASEYESDIYSKSGTRLC